MRLRHWSSKVPCHQHNSDEGEWMILDPLVIMSNYQQTKPNQSKPNQTNEPTHPPTNKPTNTKKN